ncbi:ATP-binding protein [Methylobacter psychrophilus]|uniref:ATP-binding protein n=1 Tax=Methylobacter psychrophilus TaxID=96941 RepID=UPI0021D4B0C1|nr:ATP-binding protein [Methylobacter psychrophilus]
MEQSCLFGPNFLEKFVGKHILYDPKVAIVELVANSWDAGAKKVTITWPSSENEQHFSIEDDGEGLTKEEFSSRWRTLAYDRISNQGDTILVNDKKRTVFGRNGVGRFAGFCFGNSYFVGSTKNGSTIEFEVKIGFGETPFTLIEHKVFENQEASGTKVFVRSKSNITICEESIRSEIGMRFLTDPSFSCYVNGVKVTFSDIPESNIANEMIVLESGDIINIRIIDTIESDKTTKQHGIAWHVNGRLVGEANWKEYGFDEIIDGRSAEAKRHTIVVSADFLAKTVKQDWTGFNNTIEFKSARDKVYEFVRAHILGQTKQKREKALENIKNVHQQKLSELTPLRVERWQDFIEQIQEECTSITEKDLSKLAGVLVRMEQSDTKFSLVNKLHELNSDQIDNLYNILADWSLDLAKEVLDELQLRLRLLDELRERVFDTNTREVQDLQPLFHQGLWIFGPEYETIEFTSNEGMSKVIQKLFDSKQLGSRNRPDFAILPDSTVGSYSYPTYDIDGGEIGVDRLVIVELKKPGVCISTNEKDQCWRYVKELMQKGLISRDTKVTCFVLGSTVDPIEREARKENNERCIIQPMDYQIVITRAKSRLLKLYERVKNAPFLEEQRKNMNLPPIQNDLISTKLKIVGN